MARFKIQPKYQGKLRQITVSLRTTRQKESKTTIVLDSKFWPQLFVFIFKKSYHSFERRKKLEDERSKGTNGSQKGPSTLKYVPPPPPPSSALINEDYKADLSTDKISALITGLSRHSTDVDATSDYTFSPR